MFHIEPNTVCQLARLDLYNGLIGDTSPWTGGGAVLSRGALTIQDCLFYQNQAVSGGAIAAMGSSLDVVNSNIYGNWATSAGGGIYIHGNTFANISNTTIQLNSANIAGGGIYIDPSTTANPTNVTLNATEMFLNSAGSRGGGICAQQLTGMGAGTALTLTGSTDIRENSVLSTDPLVSKGGGVYFGAGTLTFAGVTIRYNEAIAGDGLYRVTGTVVSPNPDVTYTDDQAVEGA